MWYTSATRCCTCFIIHTMDITHNKRKLLLDLMNKWNNNKLIYYHTQQVPSNDDNIASYQFCAYLFIHSELELPRMKKVSHLFLLLIKMNKSPPKTNVNAWSAATKKFHIDRRRTQVNRLLFSAIQSFWIRKLCKMVYRQRKVRTQKHKTFMF